ncbi:MAG: hypothetical protein J6U17_01840 [Kiritimatiellae bacterium]|nr:hypothetical protein [Kiritimatiellia bacterium]
MKIKKPITTAKAPGGAPAPAAPAGGAAIADRFRLDVPAGPSAANGTVGKTAALCALVAGGISLAVAGILTFLLYSHWEYLMPA